MAKTRTQSKSLQVPPPRETPVFDIASRFMAPHIEVPIMDTLVDRTVDTGARITIKSSQSVAVRDAARAFRSTVQLDGTDMTPTQVDDLFLAQLVAATESWSGFTNGGVEVPCTPENVKALYSDPACTWIYAQVFSAFLDTTRFFDTPRTS